MRPPLSIHCMHRFRVFTAMILRTLEGGYPLSKCRNLTSRERAHTLRTSISIAMGRFGVASAFPRLASFPPLQIAHYWNDALRKMFPENNHQYPWIKYEPVLPRVRVVANIPTRYMQCMDNGERLLPNMIFKTV